MSKEDVINHIEGQLDGDETIDSGDVLSPRCAWCGETVVIADPDVTVWEVEHEGGVAKTRYFYCSESHENKDRTVAIDPYHDIHPESEGYEMGIE